MEEVIDIRKILLDLRNEIEFEKITKKYNQNNQNQQEDKNQVDDFPKKKIVINLQKTETEGIRTRNQSLKTKKERRQKQLEKQKKKSKNQYQKLQESDKSFSSDSNGFFKKLSEEEDESIDSNSSKNKFQNVQKKEETTRKRNRKKQELRKKQSYKTEYSESSDHNQESHIQTKYRIQENTKQIEIEEEKKLSKEPIQQQQTIEKQIDLENLRKKLSEKQNQSRLPQQVVSQNQIQFQQQQYFQNQIQQQDDLEFYLDLAPIVEIQEDNQQKRIRVEDSKKYTYNLFQDEQKRYSQENNQIQKLSSIFKENSLVPKDQEEYLQYKDDVIYKHEQQDQKENQENQDLKQQQEVLQDQAENEKNNQTVMRYFIQNQNKVCHRCKKVGHFEQHCPFYAKIQCFYCLSDKHLQKDCTQQVCFRCGGKGHMRQNCTSLYKEKYDSLELNMYQIGKSLIHQTQEFQNNLQQDIDNIQCLKCLKKGHINCKDIYKIDALYHEPTQEEYELYLQLKNQEQKLDPEIQEDQTNYNFINNNQTKFNVQNQNNNQNNNSNNSNSNKFGQRQYRSQQYLQDQQKK